MSSPLADSPQAVLAAGSLANVPVTPQQAAAISQLINHYKSPESPCLALHSWSLPAPSRWVSGASPVAGQVEAHFDHLPAGSHTDLCNPPIHRDVHVYAANGSLLSTQHLGLISNA